jgi:stage II sporulation protein M
MAMDTVSDRTMYLLMLGLVAAVFFGTCIYGYTLSVADPETGNASAASFRQVAEELDSAESGTLFWQIFLNNLKVCLILFMGGVTFGVVPVLILLQNGYIIGSIAEVMLRYHDVPVFAASLVPHGIFEIPALLMSAALGLQLSSALLLDGLGYSNAGNSGTWYGTRFLLIVVPLLFVAAAVETFVSPAVAAWVLLQF